MCGCARWQAAVFMAREGSSMNCAEGRGAWVSGRAAVDMSCCVRMCFCVRDVASGKMHM